MLKFVVSKLLQVKESLTNQGSFVHFNRVARQGPPGAPRSRGLPGNQPQKPESGAHDASVGVAGSPRSRHLPRQSSDLFRAFPSRNPEKADEDVICQQRPELIPLAALFKTDYAQHLQSKQAVSI
jgi:hypothetical protein